MKLFHLLILSGTLLFLCSCTMFYSGQSDPAAAVQSPKPLSVPVGKNWQVVEEAPKLGDDRGRLPFQTEQSLQPDGAKTAAPVDNRNLGLPR